MIEYEVNGDGAGLGWSHLGLSDNIVKMRRDLILEKIRTQDIPDAIRLAVEAGL